jgi:hypothetical protein
MVARWWNFGIKLFCSCHLRLSAIADSATTFLRELRPIVEQREVLWLAEIL